MYSYYSFTLTIDGLITRSFSLYPFCNSSSTIPDGLSFSFRHNRLMIVGSNSLSSASISTKPSDFNASTSDL